MQQLLLFFAMSPETCRVKPLRRINAIIASCWIYFTIMLSLVSNVYRKDMENIRAGKH